MSRVDLTFTRSGEFEVFVIDGQTGAGVDWVDAFLGGPDMVVVDAGRIVLPLDLLGMAEAAALADGLIVQIEVAP